jgi:hypothetical protein
VADRVNQDNAVGQEDLVEDAVLTFPDFVQSGELAFQGVEFRGIKIEGEPLESINHAFRGDSIELLEVLSGRL